MSKNVSILSLGPDARQQIAEQLGQQEAARPKYGNKRTKFKSVQGFTAWADSKLEAALFARLDQDMVAGHVKWWIPHPRFPLPGKVVYEADALAVQHYQLTGTYISVYDAKGFDTQASINKRKQVKDLYGIEVELVRA